MASLTEFPIYEWMRKRAWEQGFQQGIEQVLEGFRQIIQEALAMRFAEDEVRAVADRLAAIKQMEQLQALLRAAIQVAELAEFTRLLDEMTDECS